ncbi:hypothetical protein GW626_17225 [Peribacillus muralis]|uniref:hypothetical protein n=1 Tax=Peribacillus muralis TaxID=264697 RepID=UPI001F4E6B4D|nr:hypothetical protein [Peribacillus muralis]MCK1992096.1 hypothetical protein [Peribacillus muralis]MCK2012652.1 hypothetical protein [Peribacillus muralis]
MKKKNIFIVGLLFFVIFVGLYWYSSSGKISGKSENGIWKVTYKEIRDVSEGYGWVASIKQSNKSKDAVVKKVIFQEDDKVLVEVTDFAAGKREDGVVTKVNPLDYPDFYQADAPKKGLTYKISVTWEKNNKQHTDTFTLD